MYVYIDIHISLTLSLSHTHMHTHMHHTHTHSPPPHTYTLPLSLFYSKSSSSHNFLDVQSNTHTITWVCHHHEMSAQECVITMTWVCPRHDMSVSSPWHECVITSDGNTTCKIGTIGHLGFSALPYFPTERHLRCRALWKNIHTSIPRVSYQGIDWFWLAIFRNNLVRGLSSKEMKFQNKKAIPVQIDPLWISQTLHQNQSIAARPWYRTVTP